MAFNKVSLVLILLIAAAIADARVDFLKVMNSSPLASKSSWFDCCDDCVKVKGSYVCLDFRTGYPPESCKFGICYLIWPPVCSCRDPIETCPPKCNSESKFADLLALKEMNY